MKATRATLQTIQTKVLIRAQTLLTAAIQQIATILLTAVILQTAAILLTRIKQVTALTNLRTSKIL